MKKIIIILAILGTGCIYGILPVARSTGVASMTSEQVGIKTVQNMRIVSHDDTQATIEVSRNNGNDRATVLAPLIDTANNQIPQVNLTGSALIDTMSPAFLTIPLWAANMIKTALGNSRYGVLSPSGMLYTTLGFEESASTGTPGFISYSNYLGTAYVKSSTETPGSGKRVDICNGSCQKPLLY